MAMLLNQMPLPGSALPTPPAECLGTLHPLEQIDVVIRLRPPSQPDDRAAVTATSGAAPAGSSLAPLSAFAAEGDLRITEVRPDDSVMVLRGSVLAVSRSFGVHLRAYRGPDGPFRARRGLVHIPVHLAGLIAAVDGLDDRPTGTGTGARTSPTGRADGPSPHDVPSPHDAPATTICLPHNVSPMSAAPSSRAGRAPAGPASGAGHAPDHPHAEEGDPVALGGCAGDPKAPGATDRMSILAEPVPAPLVTASGTTAIAATGPTAGSGSVRPLSAVRTSRRGPLVLAAEEQRTQRLARALHPSHPAWGPAAAPIAPLAAAHGRRP